MSVDEIAIGGALPCPGIQIKSAIIIQTQIGDAVSVGILLICSQKVTLELKVDDGDIKSDASVFSCIGCLF